MGTTSQKWSVKEREKQQQTATIREEESENRTNKQRKYGGEQAARWLRISPGYD